MATSSAVAKIALKQRPLAPAPQELRGRRVAKRPSPFVKWVGGKGRLMAQLSPLMPPGVEKMRHVEPFVGGGAMFFARHPTRALLCDVNASLINTYRQIRNDVDEVIAELAVLAAAGHDKDTYYGVRERYNAHERLDAARAAMFVYLNKTCFNGLHRVNRKGRFNVPVGRYKNPTILDTAGLYAASDALKHADIRCSGFEALVESARPGDFVYFDPPYEPVSRTANFTSYATGGFEQADQERLRDVYKALDRRGCKLMLSNSDVPFIRELYADFRIDTVQAARAINSNGRRRGAVSEVVVRNY